MCVVAVGWGDNIFSFIYIQHHRLVNWRNDSRKFHGLFSMNTCLEFHSILNCEFTFNCVWHNYPKILIHFKYPSPKFNFLTVFINQKYVEGTQRTISMRWFF